MTIIIGMGTGRCGTTSLAELLVAQEGAVCFHELNWRAMSWMGAERVVQAGLDGFAALLAGRASELNLDAPRGQLLPEYKRMKLLSRVTAIGDIGFYFLPYVPLLVERSAAIRMPCLRRDRAGTVKSFLSKMKVRTGRRWGRRQFGTRNHFAAHDGRRWILDERWDKCFPKYDASSPKAGVGTYWDDYYETAERFAAQYPEQFRVFEMEELNSPEGQRRILEFCGFETPRLATVHANATR